MAKAKHRPATTKHRWELMGGSAASYWRCKRCGVKWTKTRDGKANVFKFRGGASTHMRPPCYSKEGA